MTSGMRLYKVNTSRNHDFFMKALSSRYLSRKIMNMRINSGDSSASIDFIRFTKCVWKLFPFNTSFLFLVSGMQILKLNQVNNTEKFEELEEILHMLMPHKNVVDRAIKMILRFCSETNKDFMTFRSTLKISQLKSIF